MRHPRRLSWTSTALAALSALAFANALRAQVWQIDPSVAPALVHESNSLLDATFVAAPAGQFIAHGDFTHVNGTAQPGLARFGADGKLDPTFAPNLAANEPVVAHPPRRDHSQREPRKEPRHMRAEVHPSPPSARSVERQHTDTRSDRQQLHYWQTRSKVEVDFVVYGDSGLSAVEVRNSTQVRSDDMRALKNFADELSVKPALPRLPGKRTLQARRSPLPAGRRISVGAAPRGSSAGRRMRVVVGVVSALWLLPAFDSLRKFVSTAVEANEAN